MSKTDWGGLIPGLNAKRYDLVSAGMSITPERCEQAAFSTPEINYTTALMVKPGNPMHLLSNMDSIKQSGRQRWRIDRRSSRRTPTNWSGAEERLSCLYC